MLTPFEHSNHVAKHNIPEKLELWTAATSGQTITPRVDFPAQYAGRVYWQISDGALKPATSGAEINHTFTANGSHRVRLIGVPINQITYLSASSDYISQDISAFPIHKYRSLAYLSLSSTSVSGDISGWTLPASLVRLYLHSTSVSGDISGWILPNSLADLYLYSTSVTVASTFAGVGTGMRDFRIQDCGLSAAHVGNVVESIWNARAGFTYATPVLNVGGMNAAPAGNVIAPIEGADWHDDSGTWIPLTAGAMIWDLAKDVNSEGFKKWTVTYNGGVASP